MQSSNSQNIKKLFGVLVNPKECCVIKTEIPADLSGYYEAIDCDCIDIVTRTINGKPFTIICDDEGLLKENPVPSAIDKNENTMLVGNIFVCNSDGENLASLSEEEAKFVIDNVSNYTLLNINEDVTRISKIKIVALKNVGYC